MQQKNQMRRRHHPSANSFAFMTVSELHIIDEAQGIWGS
jgi:hypothetical protein